MSKRTKNDGSHQKRRLPSFLVYLYISKYFIGELSYIAAKIIQ